MDQLAEERGRVGGDGVDEVLQLGPLFVLLDEVLVVAQERGQPELAQAPPQARLQEPALGVAQAHADLAVHQIAEQPELLRLDAAVGHQATALRRIPVSSSVRMASRSRITTSLSPDCPRPRTNSVRTRTARPVGGG